MDKAYIQDLLKALKAELIRFRFWVVTLFVIVSFVVLILGMVWPKTYTTSAVLADETKVIEPLMKGTAELTRPDRLDQAREVMYTYNVMIAVGKARKLITDETTPEQQEKVVQSIRRSLVLTPVQNNQFRLSYRSNNPDTAFEMLNTIIAMFIADTERRKREQSQGAYNFIDAQVRTYEKQLSELDEKLKQFNSKNVDGDESSVAARLAQLRTEIETQRITVEEISARVNSLQQQLGNEGQYQHAKGQVDELRSKKQNLVHQLEQMQLTYQESYPDIVSLKTQITELDASIAKIQTSGETYTNTEKVANPLFEELRKQLSVAEVELRAQNRRMESLSNLQVQERLRAERIATNKAQYADISRDYEVTKKSYDDMTTKRQTAHVSLDLDLQGQGLSYGIREQATFPLSPSGLVFIHFAILGPFLGLVIPLALLMAYVMFDPHIRSARILAQQMPEDVDILGVIPHYDSPLGSRLLRKDMVALLGATFISMLVYLIIALYWHLAKG